VVYGGLFALLAPRLPDGTHTARGIVLDVAGWLLMIVAVMPMAGAALFALNFGTKAPVMILMLHVIFGAVLGWIYGRLLHWADHVHT
jgi:hypothetical protein